MKHLTRAFILPFVLIPFLVSCGPTEECDHTVNRPECEHCCLENDMEYYDWGHLDQECYCN